MEKTNQEIIENKNCLGVKLVFNTPLSQRQWHTMRTYFKFDTIEAEQTATRKIKNSWKGLIMLLLSLIYCKYGKSTVAKLIRRNDFAGKKYKSRLASFWNYTDFMDSDKKNKLLLEATESCSSDDDIVLFFNKETRKGFLEKRKQEEEAKFKALLLELPPDSTFEQIAVPPSWKPCYIKTEYTPRSIEGNMMVLAKLLDLDEKKSIIATEYYKEIPYDFAISPAKFQDTSGLLCSCPAELRFTYGIEIVEHEAFFTKLASQYVQVIEPKIAPTQIKNGHVPIYGYNLSASTKGQLSAYFPFMETEFVNALQTMGGNAWVVFDAKHLGKWG